MQAVEVQAATRKRPRPHSGDVIQPKVEQEDEPISQRPRVGDRQPVSTAGSLPSEAAEHSSVPVGSAPAGNAVDSPAEGQPASGLGRGGSAGTAEATPADDQHVTPDVTPPNTVGAQDAEPLHGSADGDKDGAAMAESTPGEGLESSQRVEEHFQPSLPMQEMVVNFLLRMAFVIGGDRDHDLQVW